MAKKEPVFQGALKMTVLPSSFIQWHKAAEFPRIKEGTEFTLFITPSGQVSGSSAGSSYSGTLSTHIPQKLVVNCHDTTRGRVVTYEGTIIAGAQWNGTASHPTNTPHPRRGQLRAKIRFEPWHDYVPMQMPGMPAEPAPVYVAAPLNQPAAYGFQVEQVGYPVAQPQGLPVGIPLSGQQAPQYPYQQAPQYLYQQAPQYSYQQTPFQAPMPAYPVGTIGDVPPPFVQPAEPMANPECGRV